LYLNLVPKVVWNIRGKNIKTDDIPVELNVADILRKI
jgi:hypothetical protein